jgi:hypothetical protein
MVPCKSRRKDWPTPFDGAAAMASPKAKTSEYSDATNIARHEPLQPLPPVLLPDQAIHVSQVAAPPNWASTSTSSQKRRPLRAAAARNSLSWQMSCRKIPKELKSPCKKGRALWANPFCPELFRQDLLGDWPALGDLLDAFSSPGKPEGTPILAPVQLFKIQ